MEYVIAIVIVALMVTVYVLSYSFNKKTAIPEGLEERHQEAQSCSACGSKNKLLIPKEIIEDFKEDMNL